MKPRYERITAGIGVAIAIGSYTSSLLGLLSDPLYVFAVLFAALCASLWNWYSAETEMNDGVGPGAKTEHARSLLERRNARNLALGTILLSAVALCIDGLSFIQLADVRSVFQRQSAWMPEPESQSDIPTHYPYKIHSADDLPMVASSIRDTFSLTITKRNRVPYVQIESVDLIIDRYTEEEPSPSFAEPAAPIRRPPLIYLANITDAVKNGTVVFPATYLDLEAESSFASDPAEFPLDMVETDPIVVLDDPMPKKLLLKVNSEVGGLFEYHVRITFRYLWQSHTWESETRKVRFLTEAQDDPSVPAEATPAPAPAPPRDEQA